MSNEWLINRYWKPIDDRNQKWFFVHINKCGGMSISHRLDIRKRHYTAQEAVDRIGKEHWDELFTFSVVRHPYARAFSLYNFRQRERRLGMDPIGVNSWVKACFKEKREGVWQLSKMQEPMVNWLKVNNEIVVDKIYKLENINEDWLDICDRIGIEERTLAYINKTSGGTIQDAIEALNDESIQILNKHFKEDFETFDYEMKKV